MEEEFRRASGGRPLEMGENSMIELSPEGKPQLKGTSRLALFLFVVIVVSFVGVCLTAVSWLR